MFSYVRLEERVPQDHPLRAIRALCDEALAGLDGKFAKLYSRMGRPSIPPEMLLRATLLQALYGVRSERQLMEQIDYNLLFRWFVGLTIDEAVWHPTTFTHNRERLMDGEVAREFLAAIITLPAAKTLMSAEHFSVDGTLIDAWASMKSFVEKDDDTPPPGGGRNKARNFRGETRSNKTHASTTDPAARLYRKGDGQESRLCFMGHVLMENRNGLVVGAVATRATGTDERQATLTLLDRHKRGRRRITLGADKAYDVADFIGELRRRTVTPHIAVNGAISKLGRPRRTVIDGRTMRHPSYRASQKRRKRIEEIFGWIKAQAGFAKAKVRGLSKVDASFTMMAAAYNLRRLATLTSP